MRPLLIAVLLLAGCSSLPRKLSPGADRSLLYPSGIYTHQVSIKTREGAYYSFKGVAKISPESIYVVGLSPLQTTVFSVEEDRKTGKVRTEIFQSELERYRDSLEDFYSTLSVFLTLKKSAKNEFQIKETRVKLVHVDENGIPDQVEIAHPRFDVVVRVVGYEA